MSTKCDLCANRSGPTPEARYDAKTIYGSWAHVCEFCYVMYTVGIGHRLREPNDNAAKAEQPPKDHRTLDNEDREWASEFIQELLDDDDWDTLLDSVVPTNCPHGCEVEPDGRCPHGHASPMVILRLI